MSERLNLVEERRTIGKLRALLRATEQMKATQRTSNNSGIIYYETKSAREYDAMIPIVYDPAFPGRRSIQVEAVFTTYRQQWPYALFLPQFYISDRPNTLEGAKLLIGDVIDQSAPDINGLEVPTQLKFNTAVSIDGVRPGETKYVYVKCLFLGTDRGSFSMKAGLL